MRRLAALALTLWFAAPARADDDVDEVARAEEALRAVADRLQLVERQYGSADDPSELLELKRRFSEGETQYLLGEHANAAALLYDVVDAPEFQAEPQLQDALFYLGDALFQQGSWLESRRTLQRLASLRGRFLPEALQRLIGLSDRLGDAASIDDTWAALAQRAGGAERLKPELIYVHAKWLSRRPDMAEDARTARALGAFKSIPDDSQPGPQARYFEGALLVQKGQLVAALQAFERMLALPRIQQALSAARIAGLAKDPGGLSPAQQAEARKASRLRDLGWLATGRILLEQGEVAQAIERYQRIERESESFPDALYELSACWQKLDEPEKALRATELLLLVIEDSPMAPEARLQQAGLQAKLKRYARAIQQYEQLAAEVKPVRDRIEELVQHDDPVTYYDELLERGDRSFDATQLLPESARRYVSGRDAAQARVITDDLGTGRRTLGEANEVLQRLSEALQAGRLDLFPTLQEGNVRAVEVENGLLRTEAQLLSVEARRIDAAGVETGRLSQARLVRQALDAQASSLPDTAAAFEERRERALKQVAELERTAFRLGSDIDGLGAQLAAADKWQRDTAQSRSGNADAVQAEREFAQRLEADRKVVAELEAERTRVRRALEVVKGTATAATAGGAGEERLRTAYLKAVQEESAASRETRERLPQQDRVLADRIQVAVQQLGALRQRALLVRASIRERARGRLSTLRARLLRERKALEEYGQDVVQNEQGTRQLLGRIAFETFSRVGRVFSDLLLKADLGVIDTAWTMKKERTDSITELEQQRRKGLKSIQDEFEEVLQEAE